MTGAFFGEPQACLFLAEWFLHGSVAADYHRVLVGHAAPDGPLPELFFDGVSGEGSGGRYFLQIVIVLQAKGVCLRRFPALLEFQQIAYVQAFIGRHGHDAGVAL